MLMAGASRNAHDTHNVDWGFCEGSKLREELYTANFHTVHGTGRRVLYVTDGKLRGGNSLSPSSAPTPAKREHQGEYLDRAPQRRSVVQAAVRNRQGHAHAQRPGVRRDGGVRGQRAPAS